MDTSLRKFIFLKILIISVAILSLNGCSGCGYFFLKINNLDTNESLESSNSSEPKNYSLTLYDPLKSPSDDRSPTLKFSAGSASAKVKLYKDFECKEIINETNSQSENDVLLTSDELSTDGEYHFSAKLFKNDGTSSGCILLNQPYILNTLSPQILSVTPSTIITSDGGTISIKGLNFVENMIIQINVGADEELVCENINFISLTEVECFAPPYTAGVFNLSITKNVGSQSILSTALNYINPPPQAPLCFNGEVTDFTIDSFQNKAFFIGNFSHVGSCNGNFSKLNINSGQISNYQFPKITGGPVNDIISDNRGGVFIAGGFSHVNGVPKNGLVHLNSDNSIDPIIGENFSYTGEIKQILIDKTNPQYLYYAGDLVPTQSIKTSGFVVTDTGQIKPNSPIISGEVSASCADGSGGFFIGGDIRWVNGIPTGGIAHILSDGNIDLTFMPSFSGGTWGYPSILTLNCTGNNLYVGGDFTTINSLTRNNLAMFDINTKTLSSWNPNPNDMVFDMVSNGTILFVGGDFSNISSQVRVKLAAYDVASGTLNNWIVNTNSFGSEIYTIEIANNILFVNGNFNQIGGKSKSNFAAIDITAATVLNMNLDTGQFFRDLKYYNNFLYLSGTYINVGGNSLKNIAKFDITNGTFLNLFDHGPNFSDMTNKIEVFNNKLFVSSYSGSSIYTIDITTGSLSSVSWQYEKKSLMSAFTFTLIDNNNLFIGGEIDGYPHAIQNGSSKLNKLNISNGSIESFPTYFDSSVNTISQNDDILFVGGNFSNYSNELNELIESFALVSKINGSIVLGNNEDICCEIKSSLIKDNFLILGGNIISAGTNVRNHLVSYDLVTNKLTSWAPSPGAHVIDIIYSDFDDKIYALTSNSLLKYQLNNNTLISTVATTTGTFRSITNYNNKLYIGGNFTNINGKMRNSMAIVNLTTGSLSELSPNVNSQINTLHVNDDSTLYIGTRTNLIYNGASRNYISAIDLTTGSLDLNFNPKLNGVINSIVTTGTELFFGGEFTSIDNYTRNRIGKYNLVQNELSPWNPNSNGTIYSVLNYNNQIFVGGDFTNLGGSIVNYFAAIDTTIGTLLPLNCNPNSRLRSLAINSDKLYLVGDFTTVNGQLRNMLAEIDLTNGSLSNFNITNYNFRPSTIVFPDNINFYSLSQGRVTGTNQFFISRINILSATLDQSYVPNPDNVINSLIFNGSEVYIGGSFTEISGHKNVNSIGILDLTTGSLLNKTNLIPKLSKNSSTILKKVNNLIYVSNPEGVAGETPFSFFGFDITSGSIIFK